jgi:hypothetical protein
VDGWWTPSSEDLIRIHLLMAIKEKADFYCMDDSPNWMTMGSNPFLLFIHQATEANPTVGLIQPMGGGSVPPLSSQAITTELPFTASMVDQVMADVSGMPQEGSRDFTS